MDGVRLISVTSRDFASLQLGRNDRDYALPIAICRLIHNLKIPTEMSGDYALTALLRDEITFHKLFERFVRNFFRIHLRDCTVHSEKLEWHDELGSEFVPAMYTDITVEHISAPFRRTIIDTKYSVRTLDKGPYGKLTFKSENIYQIYSYLRTQEHLSQSHRDANGILIYPTNGYNVDDEMLVQGHRIRIATIDLSLSWHDIEQRLLSFVSPHLVAVAGSRT